MPVPKDVEKGRRAAELLVKAFMTTGIHGRKNMPEDTLPAGTAEPRQGQWLCCCRRDVRCAGCRLLPPGRVDVPDV